VTHEKKSPARRRGVGPQRVGTLQDWEANAEQAVRLQPNDNFHISQGLGAKFQSGAQLGLEVQDIEHQGMTPGSVTYGLPRRN
jgi:hypothetical protein